MFLHADSEDSDQTQQMPRLIRVFAGRTGKLVAFVMLRLICKIILEFEQTMWFARWHGIIAAT